MNEMIERIEMNPIIAAVRKKEDVAEAVKSQVSAVFLLHADIFSLKEIIETIKAGGKSAFIHIDFLEGLGKDNKAIEYIAQVIRPDGIISTRTNQIKYAMEIGLFAIQRFFLIDSLSYETTIKTVHSIKPNMIEIMPGIMPSVISKICAQVHVPVIAGGMIENKSEIMDILRSGAIGASTGKKELWML